MDPMQVQNPQVQIPTTPVQQVVMPMQQPVAAAPMQQPVAAAPVQQAPAGDSFFDKLLKGIVDFIAKMATPPTQQQAPVQQPMQQVAAPMQQPVAAAPVQQAPIQQPTGLLGQLGSSLENIANQAVQTTQSGFSNVVAGAQDYVNQPVNTQPTVDMQQFLAQNYQQQAPVVAPVQEVPVVAPVQVAPVVAPVQEPVAAPVQEPVATPVQEVPVAAPVQEVPVAAPVQEPVVTPVQE